MSNTANVEPHVHTTACDQRNRRCHRVGQMCHANHPEQDVLCTRTVDHVGDHAGFGASMRTVEWETPNLAAEDDF